MIRTASLFGLALGILSVWTAPACAARTDPDQQLAKLLAGRTAGKPVNCINQFPTADSVTIPGRGIVYKIAGTYYLNTFEGGCPELDGFSFIATRTPTTQLCRGDIAQVLSRPPVVPRGACSFGMFTPYRRDKAVRR